ncbi:hypothetical protein GHK78_04330 [Sinorhizobium meliloti]|nr:hypothetical protein [Sinorhizobium meliloti]
MVSASYLSVAEIRIIKRMLLFRPRPTNQSILAYFTRPGRDLNHRIIAEIEGWRGAGLTPASEQEARAYMRAASLPYPEGHDFTASGFHAPNMASRVNGSLHLDWWPAGQGLFSTGAISNGHSKPLTWVFDCGTDSGSAQMDVALAQFAHRQESISSREISLASISHFDADHVNGFVKLLALYPVDTLLLPYVPLWQRLLALIEQGVPASSPLVGFFLDPGAFLASVGEIRKIIYVPISGPDDLPPPPEPPPVPSGPSSEDGNLAFDEGKPQADGLNDPIVHSHAIRARFLRPGGRIRSAFWEFVPYNDSKWLAGPPAALSAKVSPVAQQLIDAQTESNRETALRALEAIYDATFGNSSKARNRISLFLYSGPVDPEMELGPYFASHPVGLQKKSKRFSQMYTGDGSLKTKREWSEFKRYFGPGDRLARSSIFQVMHHGAKDNWHNGMASFLSPAVSLFCSDPTRKRPHPHADVLRDFWQHHPVQVGTKTGFHLQARLYR